MTKRNQHSQIIRRRSRPWTLWFILAGWFTCGASPTVSHAISPKEKPWSTFHELVQRWLKRPAMRGARVGIAVSTLDGKLLYQHNANETFFPASNTKLITMAAALSQLGSAHRFVTRLYATREINARGVLRGDLYIRGSGDPMLRSEELWRISRDLHNRGLRRITGRIVFDDTYFDRQGFGTGWRHHKHQWYRPYLAPIGGLSLNFNALGIVVRPGTRVGRKARITVDPPGSYIRRIINRTRTVRRGRFRVKFKVLSYRGFRDQIVVTGTVPRGAGAKTYWRRINHPGWYTAFSFAETLRRERIRVSRYPKRGRVPSSAKELYKHHSPPLRLILQYTGKYSSNFATEQLLKTLGAESFGAPGSWEKGLKVIQQFMTRLGLPPTSYKMVNGSGLGRINRFSPLQLSTVLRHMYSDFALRPEFVISQPTAGLDGTLRRRMRDAPTLGRLRAKTGTIDGISTLSGYVATRSGQILVFSFCMNSTKAHVIRIKRRLRKRLQRQTREFRRFQNALGEMLATYPNFVKP